MSDALNNALSQGAAPSPDVRTRCDHVIQQTSPIGQETDGDIESPGNIEVRLSGVSDAGTMVTKPCENVLCQSQNLLWPQY